MTSLAWSDISTDGLPGRQRLDFWRESVLQHTDSRLPDDVGGASVRARRRGVGSEAGVGFWKHDVALSTPIEIERTAGRCRRDGHDHFFIACPIEPVPKLAHGNFTGAIHPGQIAIFDSARPWRASSLVKNYFAVTLPRRLVHGALGHAGDRLGGRVLIVEPGLHALLTSHADALAQNGQSLSPAVLHSALGFISSVCLELLCRHDGLSDAPDRTDRHLLAAIKRQIESRLDDPGLSVPALAAAIGASRASLYRAFKDEKHGINAYITMARLERVRDLLAGGDGRAIGNVAFACGFDDVRSFNRLFRRQFGCTPSEMRAPGPARC